MSELLISFTSLALVNHLVLVHVLGLEAWAVSPDGMRRSLVFGLCTAIMLCLVSLPGWVILKLAAVIGDETTVTWLALPIFALLAVMLVPLLRSAVQRYNPADAVVMNEVMPLAAVNSAVIGTALSAWQRLDSLLDVAGFVISSAVAFVVFLMVFAAIRERTSTSDVPFAFQGTPIVLLSAAIMSLAIMAFDGVAPPWVP